MHRLLIAHHLSGIFSATLTARHLQPQTVEGSLSVTSSCIPQATNRPSQRSRSAQLQPRMRIELIAAHHIACLPAPRFDSAGRSISKTGTPPWQFLGLSHDTTRPEIDTPRMALAKILHRMPAFSRCEMFVSDIPAAKARHLPEFLRKNERATWR